MEDVWPRLRQFNPAEWLNRTVWTELSEDTGLTNVLGQNWFAWSLFLVVLLPLLILLVGEIMHRAVRRDSPMVTMWRSLRNLVLPTLGILLLMTKVLQDPPMLGIRVVQTFFWVFVLNTALALVNGLLFTDEDGDSWRARVPKLVLDMSRFFLVLVGAAFVLSAVWEQNLGQLLTALGVGSIVLGLALQDTLGALFSGVALISGRAFAVGDWIRIGDTTGEVVGMTWRTVALRTRDGDLVIVPNGSIAKEAFSNFCRPDALHRDRIDLDLHFDDEPNRVQQVFTEAARSTPGVLSDPPPEVYTSSYGADSIRHEVYYWIDDFRELQRIRNRLVTRLYYVAKRAEFTWPTPQREIYMVEGLPRQSGETLEERIGILRELDFFDGTDEEVRQLAAASDLQQFGAGEIMVKQEEIVEQLLVLVKGRAEVFYRDELGGRYELHKLGRGEFFGEAALWRSERAMTTVAAVGDVEVLALEPSVMNALLDQHPGIAKQFEEVIQTRKNAANRVREMLQRMRANPAREEKEGTPQNDG